MRTDDFMFYYADIFVDAVQYGNRSNLCNLLWENKESSDEEQFLAIT